MCSGWPEVGLHGLGGLGGLPLSQDFAGSGGKGSEAHAAVQDHAVLILQRFDGGQRDRQQGCAQHTKDRSCLNPSYSGTVCSAAPSPRARCGCTGRFRSIREAKGQATCSAACRRHTALRRNHRAPRPRCGIRPKRRTASLHGASNGPRSYGGSLAFLYSTSGYPARSPCRSRSHPSKSLRNPSRTDSRPSWPRRNSLPALEALANPRFLVPALRKPAPDGARELAVVLRMAKDARLLARIRKPLQRARSQRPAGRPRQ